MTRWYFSLQLLKSFCSRLSLKWRKQKFSCIPQCCSDCRWTSSILSGFPPPTVWGMGERRLRTHRHQAGFSHDWEAWRFRSVPQRTVHRGGAGRGRIRESPICWSRFSYLHPSWTRPNGHVLITMRSHMLRMELFFFFFGCATQHTGS